MNETSPRSISLSSDSSCGDSDFLDDTPNQKAQPQPTDDFEQRADFYKSKRESTRKMLVSMHRKHSEQFKINPISNQLNANVPTGGAEMVSPDLVKNPSNLRFNKTIPASTGRERRLTVQFDQKTQQEIMRKAMSSVEQDSGVNTPIQRGDKEGGKVRKTMILGRVESEDPFKELKGNEDSIAGPQDSVSLFNDQSVFRRQKSIKEAMMGIIGKFHTAATKSGAQLLEKSFQRQFQEKNPSLHMMISEHTKVDSAFATVWSKLILSIHTYYFFTCFWFLSFPGWPDGAWISIEIVSELIVCCDFLLRIIIRRHDPVLWESMWLLHDKGTVSRFHFVIRLIGSIPTSLILTIALQKDQEVLASFGIACIRCLKLLRLRQVNQYFQAMDLEKKRSSRASLFKVFEVTYYFLLAVHFIACAWLITGRLDPNRTNWYEMAFYNKFPDVSHFQMYIDAIFFVIATIGGMGFGNIYPTTNLEFFIDNFIMVAGSSTYANFFADFSIATQVNNRKVIQNENMLHHARKFAAIKNLGEEVLIKIRYFYTTLRLSFDEFSQKHEILKELPVSLQGEVSLLFNSFLIQNVAFFQLAEPAFIVQISRSFEPYLCISGESVVRVDEIAGRMYFIHTGYVEILASDNRTTIAYQGKGCYFGEIGLLLTGKRTCNVKSCATSILYTISGQNLKAVLELFPKQLKFLKAVGRQRLQTTHPDDISTNIFDRNTLVTQLRNDFEKMLEENNDFLFGDTANQKHSRVQEVNLKATTIDITRKLSMRSNLQSNSFESKDNFRISLQTLFGTKTAQPGVKVKPWLTENFATLDKFIIIPFSKIFNVWHVFLLLAIWYNFFMVMYTIGNDVNFDSWVWYLVDWIAIVIYVIDIWFRLNTALTSYREICLDKKKILGYYINNYLLLDVLATVPFEYMLMIFEMSDVWRRWVRLLRMLKLVRVNEIIEIIKFHSNTNLSRFTLIRLFIVYICGAHFIACGYVFIANREAAREVPTRFDGQYFYKNLLNRKFVTMPPILEMPTWDRYVQSMYMSSSMMGAIMYGDAIPLAYTEQIFSLFAMVFARIYLAFLFAEAAYYLGSLHQNKQSHTQKINKIRKWLKVNSFPDPIISRAVAFHQLLWEDFQGIDQEAILKDLPESLSNEIRAQMLTPLLENWKAIPKDNHGALQTMIKRLRLTIFPAGEFVIRYHEVAYEMFFINKGIVRVTSADGVEFATLRQGDNFGEMALLDTNKPIRGANIVTITKVWLAVLTLQDFKLICDMYPSFNDNIFKIVQQRQLMNFEREKNQKLIDEQNRSLNTVREEDGDSPITSQESEVPKSIERAGKDKILINVEGLNKEQTDRNVSLLEDEQAGFNGLELDQKNLSEHHEFSLQEKPVTKKKSSKKFSDIEVEKKYEEMERVATEDIFIGHEDKKLDNVEQRSSQIPTPKFKKNQTLELKIQATGPSNSSRGLIKPKESSVQAGSARRGRRSTVLVAGVQQHFEIDQTETMSQERKDKPMCCNLRCVIRYVVLGLSTYNVIFIPLQFAFRISFSGIFLALEIITIFFYLVDAVLRFQMIGQLIKIDTISDAKLTFSQKKLKVDREKLNARISMCKKEIVFSLIAAIPVAAIANYCQWYDPWYVVALLKSNRLVKLRPIFQGFSQLKKQSLNTWRMVEVIIYFYFMTNYIACLCIMMAAWAPDARETWLRRVPVPQWTGIRKEPNIWTDTSPESVYIHALFYVVNTVSHVAVGDITSISVNERFLNCFLCLFGTFMYSFLFGNITALVAGLAPGTHLAFHRRQNQVMQKLKNDKIPESLVKSVNSYFDYEWAAQKGFDELDLMSELPSSIRADIFLSRYQEMIESSLIFRESEGQIDVAMTNSIFRLLKIEVFMSKHFLLKIGHISEDSFILLDGEVSVHGLFMNEKLGTLFPGSHVSVSLAADAPGEVAKKANLSLFNSQSIVAQLDPEDNLEGKATFHLVANTFVQVGVLKAEDLQVLFKAYPDWKIQFQTLNRFLFNLGVASLERFVKSKNREPTRKGLLQVIDNHYTYSTDDDYEKILNQSESYGVEEFVDLTRMLKQHYISISPHTMPQKLTLQNLVLKPSRHSKLGSPTSSCGMDRFLSVDFSFEKSSKSWRAVEILQFINLLYIGVAEPFYVSFLIPTEGVVMILEGISLALSLIVIFLNFRTPILVKNEMTLRIDLIAKNYWQNGLLFDICGLIPLNIILGGIDIISLESRYLKCFLFVVRLVRMISFWHTLKIFQQFEIYLKKYNMTMQIIKAIAYNFFLGHWLTCMWNFTNYGLESDEVQTWATINKAYLTTLGEQYLLSYYAVINVVATVGYGDMYPATDLERLFFTLMITFADVLFALAFGLIANLSMQNSTENETQNFVEKMCEIQALLDTYNVAKSQKQRVEEYFAFAFFTQNNSTIISRENLEGKISPSLVKTVLYYSNKDQLKPLFADFGSENLLKEISYHLTNVIYLPQDFIIEKGTVGEEMYFLIEGLVMIIAADKQTVLTTLQKGSYFGEIAILFKSKRTSYVQAESFCVVSVLKKSNLDEVLQSFPQIEQAFRLKAQKRLAELDKMTLFNSRDDNLSGGGGSTTFFDYSKLIEDGNVDDSFQRKVEALLQDKEEEKGFQQEVTNRSQHRSTSREDNIITEKSNMAKAAIQEHRNLAKRQKDKSFRSNRSATIDKSPVALQGLLRGKKNTYFMAQEGADNVSIRVSKTKRRLSRISLGKNLKLSQTAGLKLQWTVGNQ